MKTKTLMFTGLLCLSGLALGAQSGAPTQKILTAALTRHLAAQGDLCLAKYDWPIDVSQPDAAIGTRDSTQMPVLEKLGLAVSSDATAVRKEDDQDVTVPVKRYALTETGRQYYLSNKVSSSRSNGVQTPHRGDFCVGKLSLDKLVRWDKPAQVGGTQETLVTYTYKVSAAPWAQDPEIQRVFPMVATILKGEGSLQLQQRFRLEGKTWVGVNPWD